MANRKRKQCERVGRELNPFRGIRLTLGLKARCSAWLPSRPTTSELPTLIARSVSTALKAAHRNSNPARLAFLMRSVNTQRPSTPLAATITQQTTLRARQDTRPFEVDDNDHNAVNRQSDLGQAVGARQKWKSYVENERCNCPSRDKRVKNLKRSTTLKMTPFVETRSN